jgi:myo-inositol-1(or 4)-monophosphatase
LREGAFHAHSADTKRAPTDLVTEFDRRSEQLLVAAIGARFPDDQILAEEGGASGGRSARRWLIDPLDGTTNFAHGLPFFVVSVGLEVDGELTVGVVEAPALGWTFAAARGAGARFNGAPMRVSSTETLAASLLATGFPYDRRTNPKNNFGEFVALKKRAHGVRRVGAAALDLAMVAAGWLDGYWERHLRPWDIAAGALLVREAGGQLSAWSGGALAIDSGEIVATNGRVHQELLESLANAPAIV